MYTKIYLTTAAYPPIYNSAEIQFFAEFLAASGFRTEVITPDLFVSRLAKDIDVDHELEKKIPQVYIKRIPGLALFGIEEKYSGVLYETLAGLDLKKSLNKEPGIIISFYPDISSLSVGVTAAQEKDVPLIIYLKENPFKKSNNKNKIRPLLKQATVIIAESESMRDIITDNNINTPVKVINPGIHNLPEIKPTGDNEKIMGLCLNCDSRYIDLNLLIKSFAMLKACHPEAADKTYLKIFGQRRKRVYTKLEPNEEERFFEFGSFITREIEDINISKSDFGIIPFSESYDKTAIPEIIFRYIAGGVPYVVSADSDSEIYKFTRTLQCGTVVPTGNPAALSGAVLELVTDRKKYNNMLSRQLKLRSSLLFSRSKNIFFDLFTSLK